MAAKHNCCQLFWCCLMVLVNVSREFASVHIPAKISSECGSNLQDNEEIVKTILQHIRQQIGLPGCNPPSNRSCLEILKCFPSAPSGYYQLLIPGLVDEQVYCDMEGTNCGGERGLTRVAYVKMTQPSATCPKGLTQTDFSGTLLCQSAMFSALKVAVYHQRTNFNVLR